jgi:hypothetical protein
MAKGDLVAALKSYEAKRDIIFRLAQSDPGNAMWQYDRSVAYNKIGNVQMAQDHLPEALACYQASFAIRDRLAKSDPGTMPAGSSSCRLPTKILATYKWRSATCRQRLPLIRRA